MFGFAKVTCGKLTPFYLARSAVSDTWAEPLALVTLTDPSHSLQLPYSGPKNVMSSKLI